MVHSGIMVTPGDGTVERTQWVNEVRRENRMRITAAFLDDFMLLLLSFRDRALPKLGTKRAPIIM
jgi:hypothetical protein